MRCLTYSEVKGRIAAIFDQPELSRQSEMSTRDLRRSKPVRLGVCCQREQHVKSRAMTVLTQGDL